MDPLEFLNLYECRTFTGDVIPVDRHRRNGRPAVTVSRAWFATPADTSPRTPEALHLPGLFANLTVLEMRTWSAILAGQSIVDIAATNGVTRAAIYARIRGTNKRPGGMVAKNPWVARWWDAHRQLQLS